MGFLLNSQAQGVFGKHEQSTQTPWRGAPEVRGPMQLHRLHWLKVGPGPGNVRMRCGRTRPQNNTVRPWHSVTK